MKVSITKGPRYEQVIKDAQLYFYQFVTKENVNKGA